MTDIRALKTNLINIASRDLPWLYNILDDADDLTGLGVLKSMGFPAADSAPSVIEQYCRKVVSYYERRGSNYLEILERAVSDSYHRCLDMSCLDTR